MIPILEIQGYIALILAIIISFTRIYYCFQKYDRQFIIEILMMAILTSFLWIVYCICKSQTKIVYQFIASILIYLATIVYLYSR